MKVGGITLRELDAKTITENVAQMCKEAAYYLPEDVYQALKKGRETEKSIIKNAEIAKAEDRPYCQDTGMTIVFLELGQDLHIVGGDLEQAVNDGIAKGYTEGYLRKSVVSEPLFNRVNTQNNTPGVRATSSRSRSSRKASVRRTRAASRCSCRPMASKASRRLSWTSSSMRA